MVGVCGGHNTAFVRACGAASVVPYVVPGERGGGRGGGGGSDDPTMAALQRLCASDGPFDLVVDTVRHGALATERNRAPCFRRCAECGTPFVRRL